MFTNILVPIDGTQESGAALPLALTVARSTGGRITLLQVVRRDSGVARRPTDGAGTDVAPDGVSITSVVRESGDVAKEIVRQIQEQSADLVVMRTHGRSGIGRAVLGSVTQEVLVKSRVPLMVLRPDERHITRIAKLLVPIDGSPGGTLALGTAVQLAKTTRARLRLVEVCESAAKSVYGDAYGAMSYYDPAWDEEALASAQGYVAGIVARLHTAGIAGDGTALQARFAVAESLVDAADQADADLIVMSTRALTGPARWSLAVRPTRSYARRTARCC